MIYLSGETETRNKAVEILGFGQPANGIDTNISYENN